MHISYAVTAFLSFSTSQGIGWRHRFRDSVTWHNGVFPSHFSFFVGNILLLVSRLFLLAWYARPASEVRCLYLRGSDAKWTIMVLARVWFVLPVADLLSFLVYISLCCLLARDTKMRRWMFSSVSVIGEVVFLFGNTAT